MGNKKILLIALAVFSMVILISQNNVPMAFAVIFHNVSYTADSGGSEVLSYLPSVDKYIVFRPSDDVIEVIDAVSFIKTSAIISAGNYQTPFDCSATANICVFLEGTGNDLRAKSSSGNAVWDNLDLGTRLVGAGDVVKIAGNIVYVPLVCSSGDADRIIGRFSTGDGALVDEIGSCTGVSIGSGASPIDIEIDGSLMAITISGASNSFQIWNINTGLRSCVNSVANLASPEGSITRLGSTWYVNDGTTMQAFTDSCGDGTDITSGNHGLTGTLVGNGAQSSRGELYIQSASSVAVMNSTTPTQLLFTVPCGDAGTVRNNFEVASDFDQIACLAQTGNSLHIRTLDPTLAEEEEDEEGSIVNGNCADTDITCSTFCETAGNQYLLRCVAEANGGSLVIGNTTNPFNPVAGTNNVVTGALGLENTDIRTNGVGYLMLGTALLIFNVLWLYGVFMMKSKGVHVDSPIFISALISFAIIFAFVLAGWTDPLILIVGIVALVAFGAPKLVGIIRGSGGSGGV